MLGRQNRAVVPAQILSGEKLQRLNSHSVSDALRYFSGADKGLRRYRGLKTVNIRSMGSQHVGVFYDGIQIGNAQNGTVDLGKFSLDNMELVSVYNGQKSDIFQSARDFASASAVYMVTRRPVFESGRRNRFNVKLKGGSFDLINASALWEHRISENLSSSANIEYLNTSGKYKFPIIRTAAMTPPRSDATGMSGFFAPRLLFSAKVKRGEWQAKGYFYNSGARLSRCSRKKDYGISLLNEDRQKDRNFSFKVP